MNSTTTGTTTIGTPAVPLPTTSSDPLASGARSTPSTMRVETMPLPSGEPPSARESSGLRDRLHRIAGTLHQLIDKVEQLVSSSAGGLSSATSSGGVVQQYGDKLRSHVDARPLAALGAAFASGLVLNRLLGRRPAPMRVVSVPVYTPAGSTGRAVEQGAARWTHAAGATLRQLGPRTRHAMQGTGDSVRPPLEPATTQLANTAAVLALQLRLAAQQLLGKTRAYGSAARAGVQAHPLIGAGAALGLVALLATLWYQRRTTSGADMAYIAVDANGNAVAWGHDPVDLQARTSAIVPPQR